MSWPDPSDYQSALEYPERSLTKALSGAVLPPRGEFEQPWPIAGANAHVYRLELPDSRSIALRLFLKRSPARFARYRALSDATPTLAALPFLVPFEWHEEGIWAAGAWRPAQSMDWIEGDDLGASVEARLGAPSELRKLAAAWLAVARDLQSRRYSHGDVQRGNIFVERTSGAMRLIDYDSLWIPGLERDLSEIRTSETGHPAFQHPQGALPGADADRFAALVVYIALRVLSVAPEVWYRLDNGDNLLFRPEDFAAPQSGRAFPLLLKTLTRHAEERALVQRLQTACRLPLEQVPSVLSFA